ncbi:MAG: hypothetical protein HYU53_02875 [Acidobacteria bacterium]|nr:hypothetical protein [Acidobacteriota bacterium]
MDRRAECVSIVRRLLEPPGESFAAEVAGVARSGLPPEAAEQVSRFSERIADLSPEERRELFDETFGRPAAADDRRRLVSLLDGSAPPEAGAEVWALIDRLGTALMRDRNPYHHLIAALGVLAPRGG